MCRHNDLFLPTKLDPFILCGSHLELQSFNKLMFAGVLPPRTLTAAMWSSEWNSISGITGKALLLWFGTPRLKGIKWIFFKKQNLFNRLLPNAWVLCVLAFSHVCLIIFSLSAFSLSFFFMDNWSIFSNYFFPTNSSHW